MRLDQRLRHWRLQIRWVLFSALITIFAATPWAADSDLWTTHSGPGFIGPGSAFTVTVGYGNHGPDAALSAYINSYHTAPMGMDVFIDNLVNGDGSIYDAIQAGAEGTDTLGNAVLLFWDDYFCEDLLFQLQRADGDTETNPVEGLDPGVTASFSYEVTLPMEEPRTGTVEIIEPVSLVGSWTGSNSANVFLLQAAELNTYGRGGCEPIVNVGDEDVCEYIDDNCFGARVSLLPDPIEAEWELVDDGSADPTEGCDALVNFTPGNVAVLRRGSCEFGDKAFNAEQAGAVATVIVNTNQCSDFPADDSCVLNIGAGALGGLVTIPVVMFAQADGEPIIGAIEGGQTVRGVFGSATKFSAEGYVFLSDSLDTDPDDSNDTSTWTQTVGAAYSIFVDGFESGDTGAWSDLMP